MDTAGGNRVQGHRLTNTLLHYLTLPFAIDLRTLALFRIGLGAMVIVDVLLRSRDLRAFYSDDGVYPRAVAIRESLEWAFSFHFINGSPFFQALLFLLTVSFSFLLVVGYRTRFATFAVLALTISMQVRNPYILQGSDILLTLLLFWSLFLPLGARFSFDEGLNTAPPVSNHYVSPASAALLLQVMSVYFSSAVMKEAYPEWSSDYTGVLYALTGGSYGTSLGQYLGQFEELTYWLTIYVMQLELFGPFLMFLSAYFAPARLALQLLFISMHLGFLLFLGVGQFPWISITSLLAFTPSQFWDHLSAGMRTQKRLAVKIYYDEPCSFCKKISSILRAFLMFPDTVVAPAQQDPDIHHTLEEHNSWVVTDHTGQHHVRWSAMILLIQNSPVFGWLAPVARLSFLRGLGERFYSWVASNRERIAEKAAPWLVTRAQSIYSSWIMSAFVVICAAIMVWANVYYAQGRPLPTPLEAITRSYNLYQPWVMFIQTPPYRSWYIAQGRTKGGEVVDVYRNVPGAPSLAVPAHAAEGGWDANFRWRKFLLNLWYPNLHHLRPFYAAYLCRDWNELHTGLDQLATITIAYVAGGGVLAHPVEQYSWGEYNCEQSSTTT
jgi:predicted DCC family thiol-disulfide oxidoreductase YuxK